MRFYPGKSDKLDQIFRRGKRLEFGKDDFIISPGEAPSGVYYIETGLIKSYYYTRFGDENLLAIRSEHEIVGLTFAITGEKLDIIYSCLTPAVLWYLPADKFLATINRSPKGASQIFRMLARMYLLHSEHILNLEYRTVRERLIASLLSFDNRFGKIVNGLSVIEIPLRHQDIASYINSSRETATRELNYLQSKRLISFSQGEITLLDVKELRSYLEL